VVSKYPPPDKTKLKHSEVDMKDLKLDDEMDLFDDGKDWATVEGGEEIAQRVKTRLYTILGEWKFDRRIGFAYHGEGGFFDSSVPEIVRLAVLRKYISDTFGIKTVDKFDAVVDDENKAINVAFEAKTTEGVLTFSEEITS